MQQIVEIVARAIMERFIEGEARTQVTSLPECQNDDVAEENPVRVVDDFVDELDLGALGFEGVDPAAMESSYNLSFYCFSRRGSGGALLS